MSTEDWSAELDLIDNELLRLLNQRARVAVGAGAAILNAELLAATGRL